MRPEDLPRSLPCELAFQCRVENIFYMDKADAQRYWFNFLNYVEYLIAHPTPDPYEEMLRNAKLQNIDMVNELAVINGVSHIHSLERILRRLSGSLTSKRKIEIHDNLTRGYILEQIDPIDNIHLMGLQLDYSFIAEQSHIFAQVPVDDVRSVVSMLFNEQVDIRKTIGLNNALPTLSFDPISIQRLCSNPKKQRKKDEIIENGHGYAVDYFMLMEQDHATHQ